MAKDPVSTERGQSILVVDDDTSVRRVLAALLVQGGYDVSGVGSGEEALAALDTGCFDLVISDLRMRGMDGMALLAAIVARHPGLPVMMLTAHGTVPLALHDASNPPAPSLAGTFVWMTAVPGSHSSCIARIAAVS